jgi:hypothetical protein
MISGIPFLLESFVCVLTNGQPSDCSGRDNDPDSGYPFYGQHTSHNISMSKVCFGTLLYRMLSDPTYVPLKPVTLSASGPSLFATLTHINCPGMDYSSSCSTYIEAVRGTGSCGGLSVSMSGGCAGGSSGECSNPVNVGGRPTSFEGATFNTDYSESLSISSIVIDGNSWATSSDNVWVNYSISYGGGGQICTSSDWFMLNADGRSPGFCPFCLCIVSADNVYSAFSGPNSCDASIFGDKTLGDGTWNSNTISLVGSHSTDPHGVLISVT